MTRQAFEEWVGKGLHLERIPTGAPFAGDYRSIVMQTRWDAWQAATNTAQAEIDKLQAQMQQALEQLQCNTTNLQKGMSKSIQRLCARENAETLEMLRAVLAAPAGQLRSREHREFARMGLD